MKLSEITNPLSPSQLKWLEDMKIKNWKYEDGVVNVKGNVNISHKKLTKIPVQFGYVSENFDCSYNQLTSLSGAPKEVGGDFYCSYNQLTSLSGAPKEVGGSFWCKNNKFKSEPDHSLIKIGGGFIWKQR